MDTSHRHIANTTRYEKKIHNECGHERVRNRGGESHGNVGGRRMRKNSSGQCLSKSNERRHRIEQGMGYSETTLLSDGCTPTSNFDKNSTNTEGSNSTGQAAKATVNGSNASTGRQTDKVHSHRDNRHQLPPLSSTIVIATSNQAIPNAHLDCIYDRIGQCVPCAICNARRTQTLEQRANKWTPITFCRSSSTDGSATADIPQSPGQLTFRTTPAISPTLPAMKTGRCTDYAITNTKERD